MIPENIEIDGMIWSVTTSDALSDFGETRVDECKIFLREDVNHQVQDVTFWHELIHAIFATRDFKLVPDCSTDELEEQVAAFLGPALWAFFKSNCSIAWIMK